MYKEDQKNVNRKKKLLNYTKNLQCTKSIPIYENVRLKKMVLKGWSLSEFLCK